MGSVNRGVFEVGPVSRTPVTVDRLQETGHDVILTKNKPRIVNLDRRGHAAEEGRRHVHSRHVDLGADESLENRELLGCCTAEVSHHIRDLVSPCSDPADKQVAGGGST